MPLIFFDHGPGLSDRGGRVLLEMRFQAPAMPHQLAFRTAKVELLEPLDPTHLIFFQVTP
jgi:hypothetical protein